jgi:heme-degrading monooxygenase HmoA
MIVVLFATTPRADLDVETYQRTSARMRELVAAMPGFISYNTYTADNGEGIAVVRFESEAALEAWRAHAEHQQAQELGRSAYYQEYWVQVCSTVREYRFVAPGYAPGLAPMFAAGSVIQGRGAEEGPGTMARRTPRTVSQTSLADQRPQGNPPAGQT